MKKKIIIALVTILTFPAFAQLIPQTKFYDLTKEQSKKYETYKAFMKLSASYDGYKVFLKLSKDEKFMNNLYLKPTTYKYDWGVRKKTYERDLLSLKLNMFFAMNEYNYAYESESEKSSYIEENFPSDIFNEEFIIELYNAFDKLSPLLDEVPRTKPHTKKYEDALKQIESSLAYRQDFIIRQQNSEWMRREYSNYEMHKYSWGLRQKTVDRDQIEIDVKVIEDYYNLVRRLQNEIDLGIVPSKNWDLILNKALPKQLYDEMVKNGEKELPEYWNQQCSH